VDLDRTPDGSVRRAARQTHRKYRAFARLACYGPSLSRSGSGCADQDGGGYQERFHYLGFRFFALGTSIEPGSRCFAVVMFLYLFPAIDQVQLGTPEDGGPEGPSPSAEAVGSPPAR
jgi:hypothetical protein